MCKIDIKICKVYKLCICSAERVLILNKVNSVLTCLDISGDKAVAPSSVVALDLFYLAVVKRLNSLCSVDGSLCDDIVLACCFGSDGILIPVTLLLDSENKLSAVEVYIHEIGMLCLAAQIVA